MKCLCMYVLYIPSLNLPPPPLPHHHHGGQLSIPPPRTSLSAVNMRSKHSTPLDQTPLGLPPRLAQRHQHILPSSLLLIRRRFPSRHLARLSHRRLASMFVAVFVRTCFGHAAGFRWRQIGRQNR